MKTRSLRIKFFIPIILIWVFMAPLTAGTDIAADNDTWKEKLIQERREKDRYFKTDPTSPMAGIKRLTVTADKKNPLPVLVVENKKTRAVSLSKTFPSGAMNNTNSRVLFQLSKTATGWLWRKHAPVVTVTVGKETVRDGTPIEKPALFEGGLCTIKAYPTKDGFVLLVFDPKRPELQQFKHLHYFKPNRDFAVTATLKKYKNPEKISVGTSQNLKKTYYRYAAIHFKLGDKELKLSAFKSSLSGGEEGSYLFIPFADATSGKETYEVGRFLEIHEPESDTFVLDFNRCFNPLCNYSPAYNCPIPPLENYLDVPVEAGEKVYPIAH